jgi:hypothetical protein
VSIKNDSAGSATATLYVDGSSVASASGLSLLNTFWYSSRAGWTDDASMFQDPESQFMFGSYYHVSAPNGYSFANGCVFFGGMKSRAYSAAEHLSLWNNPYQFLLP